MRGSHRVFFLAIGHWSFVTAGNTATGRDNALASWVEMRFAKDMLRSLEDAERAFTRMDTNADGVLSKTEFKMGLRSAGFQLSEPQMEQLIRVFDRGNKGHITLSDFKARFFQHLPRGRGMGKQGEQELQRSNQKLRDSGGLLATLTSDERIDYKVCLIDCATVWECVLPPRR